MPVVAAYLYRNGIRVREVEIDEVIDCPDDRSEFVWIGICDPTRGEMELLQHRYGLHPLAVEDAINTDQLPKIDVYGAHLFVVARTASLKGEVITHGETAMFVGHSHIISVRHGSARHHKQLRAQLEASPGLLVQGVDFVLHSVLDFIVDGYLPVVDAIEDRVLAMEQEAMDGFLDREAVRRIFGLRRQLLLFQRILDPMEKVTGQILRLDLPCLDPETRPYFRDILDHIRRVHIRVGGLREILHSVFDLSVLLEQQRAGAITRQLAAWAAILAVPTAIAGIYGMNFDYMPELKVRYGYFAVLCVIGLICIGLFLRFRRARWL